MTSKIFDNHNPVNEGESSHQLSVSMAEASNRLVAHSHELSDNIIRASGHSKKGDPEEMPDLVDLVDEMNLDVHRPHRNKWQDPHEYLEPKDPDSYD